MIKIVCAFFFFLLIASLELGFVYALPFPVDRLPLVLCVSVYVFQALNIRQAAWWVVGYGFILDLLSVSFVRLELVSYTLASMVLVLTAKHVFSHRSYWGILGTLTFTLAVLTSMEVIIALITGLLNAYSVPVQTILSVRVWGWGLSVAVLLLFFPLSEFLARMRLRILSL